MPVTCLFSSLSTIVSLVAKKSTPSADSPPMAEPSYCALPKVNGRERLPAAGSFVASPAKNWFFTSLISVREAAASLSVGKSVKLPVQVVAVTGLSLEVPDTPPESGAFCESVSLGGDWLKLRLCTGDT